MNRLWLIQRGKIKTPLADETACLSAAYHNDYMGAAEFEFGALPDSLRAMRSNKKDLVARKIPTITKGEHQLRTYSYLNDAEWALYVPMLEELRNTDKVRLKERSQFSLPEQKRDEEWAMSMRARNKNVYVSEPVNFWWDINHHVMFSFEKNFMNRLPKYLENSFGILAEKK